MGSFFSNKNQMILVNYMDLYFNHKPTDCTLYSDDGYEFPIHQVSFITFIIHSTYVTNNSLLTDFSKVKVNLS